MKDIIAAFSRHKILVIGDLVLDTYLYGSVDRISPEAPVPVLNYQQEEYRGGAAVNVALNLASVGAVPCLAGVCGTDEAGEKLRAILKENKIDDSLVVEVPGAKTSNKTRIISGQQQLLRLDNEDTRAVSDDILERLMSTVKAGPEDYSAVIVSDYGKGMINPQTLKVISGYAAEKKIPVIVDPKKKNFGIYHNVTCMTPNHLEAAADASLPCEDDVETIKAGEELIKKHGLEYILITRGAKGMLLLQKDGKKDFIQTCARDVYDVSGAGDTVISIFTCAVAAGADLKDAAILANQAAGIVVGKFGICPVEKEELLKVL